MTEMLYFAADEEGSSTSWHNTRHQSQLPRHISPHALFKMDKCFAVVSKASSSSCLGLVCKLQIGNYYIKALEQAVKLPKAHKFTSVYNT